VRISSIFCLLIIFLFAPNSVFAHSRADIIDYQNRTIDRLLYNYSLEKNLRFDIENNWDGLDKLIKKNKEKSATAEVDNFLHLLKVNYRSPDHHLTAEKDEKKLDIDDILVELDTKIIFNQTDKITEDEKSLITKLTKEKLKIKDDSSITFNAQKEEKFGPDQFLSKAQENFWSGLYKFLIEDSGYIFIIGLLLVSLVFFASFSKNAKKISEGMKEIKLSPPPKPESQQAEKNIDDNKTAGLETIDKDDDLSELENIPSTQEYVSKIDTGMDSQPAMCKFYLWKHLPKPQEQMFFLNYINSNNETDEVLNKKVKAYLIESFGWNEQDSRGVIKSKRPDKQNMIDLFTSLSQLEFTKTSESETKLINAIFPKFGLALDKLLDKYFSSHLVVLYKLFPDTCINYAEKKITDSPEIMAQLADLLYSDEESLSIDEVSVQSFCNDLKNTDPKELLGQGAKTVNTKILSMFYALSDDKVKELALWDKMDDETKAAFPTLNWITDQNTEVLKTFLTSLSNEEALVVQEQILPSRDLLKVLDERSKYRFQEKVKDANLNKFSWKPFRAKISQYFSNPDTQDNTEGAPMSKAS
jgi:hypothetical protein